VRYFATKKGLIKKLCLKITINNKKSEREENYWEFGKFCGKKYTSGGSQKTDDVTK
jgi:hypothetical protein